VFSSRAQKRIIQGRSGIDAKTCRIYDALIVVALASFLALFSVTTLVSDVGADTTQKPDFVIAYSPRSLVDVDPKDAMAAFKIYVEELARKIGYTGASAPYDNVESVMKEVENGKVDMISMSSIQYLRVRNKSLIEPAYGNVRGGKTTLRYLLLVNNKQGFMKITDLQGKKVILLKGEEIGALYLNVVLLRQRLGEARDFFSSVDEKVKTSQAVLSVFFGQADACVVNDLAYQTMIEMNPQLGRDLKALYTSPELLDNLAVFRKNMDNTIKQKTREVASGLKTNPRGKQILMLFKIEDLAPIKESDMSATKELLAEYDRLRAKR
jgi:ABC-type phosphate/phosphonate transport system substrate-binding protein